MPTYDYECSACGHVFEVFEKMSDSGAKECRKCRRRKANRRFSASGGVIFKGAGFYVTDSKRSTAAGDGKKKTTRKTTETKPEPKTESKAEKTEKK